MGSGREALGVGAAEGAGGVAEAVEGAGGVAEAVEGGEEVVEFDVWLVVHVVNSCWEWMSIIVVKVSAASGNQGHRGGEVNSFDEASYCVVVVD